MKCQVNIIIQHVKIGKTMPCNNYIELIRVVRSTLCDNLSELFGFCLLIYVKYLEAKHVLSRMYAVSAKYMTSLEKV